DQASFGTSSSDSCLGLILWKSTQISNDVLLGTPRFDLPRKPRFDVRPNPLKSRHDRVDDRADLAIKPGFIARSRRHMRRQDHVLDLAQWMIVSQGLARKHIKRGAGDPAALQGGNKSVLIDDRTTGCIDNNQFRFRA